MKCDRPFCFTVSTNDRRPKDCMTFKSSGGDSCRFSGIMEKTTKYDFIWLDKLWYLGENLYLRQQNIMLSATCIYLL